MTTYRNFITVNHTPYFVVKNHRKYGETIVVNSSVSDNILPRERSFNHIIWREKLFKSASSM